MYIDTHHDDVIKWKHFPRYWPFVRGIHRSPVNSPHKGQWREALVFSLICALNKPFSKKTWGWWFETTSRSWWRHSNGNMKFYFYSTLLAHYMKSPQQCIRFVVFQKCHLFQTISSHSNFYLHRNMFVHMDIYLKMRMAKCCLKKNGTV